MPVNERLTGNLTVGGTITQGGATVQNALSLTTTGTSGAATLVGSTLNIPQYSGGGASGIHVQLQPTSGMSVSPLVNGNGVTTVATILNRMYAIPFIPNKTFTSSSLAINVTVLAAGGNGRILIYSDLNGKPDTKIFESSNLDCSTTGFKTATLSQTFNAGTTYWLCTYFNSATITVSAHAIVGLMYIANSGSGYSSSYFITPTFGSAPTTFGSGSLSGTNVPAIYINVA